MTLKQIHQAAKNTDRELWRERQDDYYADSIHVTEGGSIGMNVGGTVAVMPIREWFARSVAGGTMTDQNSEPLNGKYKQAYEFAMNDHLQAKQDLESAKAEIEELKFKLTDAQVKIDAMDAFNKLLEDRLNIAMVDRTRAIDERAELSALIDVILAAIEKRKHNAT